MNEEVRKHEVFSYDVLGEFNHLYYKDLITENHCLEETFLVDSEGEKKFFYPLKYRKRTYALEADRINRLPLRVKDSVKVGHRTSVYYWITNFSSAVIKGKKTWELKKLVREFAPFEEYHSNPIHWTLYKATVLCLLNDKGFVRVATEAGFGKTSPFSMLNPLTNKAVSINPRSAAAFEYRLIYPLINLDELTNLQKNQRDVMQDALLKTADWSPNYQKGTRGSKKYGTTDDMDISDTSLIITFNTTDHYKASGQLDNYFDKVFQHAVLTRFLPFKFEGVLKAEAFAEIKNAKQTAKDNYDHLIEVVKNIVYYKEHLHEHMHNYRWPQRYSFDKTGRQIKTFRKIANFLDVMCETQEEFTTMITELYNCYVAYNTMINNSFSYESNEVREVETENELTVIEDNKNNS